MPVFTSTFRRRALQQFALVALTLLTAACGALDVCTNGSEVALGKKPPPVEQYPTFPTMPPTAATATSTASPKTTVTVTAAPGGGGQAIGGSIGLGYDHPPFMQPWGVGGNSVAFVCGSMTGGPTEIQVDLTGTTGQPRTLLVPIGPDGKFSAPFPIMQYGTLNASVSQAQTASGPRPVSGIAAKPLEVKAGADVACAP